MYRCTLTHSPYLLAGLTLLSAVALHLTVCASGTGVPIHTRRIILPALAASPHFNSLLHWFPGTLVHWYTGTLVHWFPGTLVHWYDTLVHWYTGAPVHWYAGTLVHWYTGTRVHW